MGSISWIHPKLGSPKFSQEFRMEARKGEYDFVWITGLLMMDMSQLPHRSRNRGSKTPGNKNGTEEIRSKRPKKSLACGLVPDPRPLPRPHFVSVFGFKRHSRVFIIEQVEKYPYPFLNLILLPSFLNMVSRSQVSHLKLKSDVIPNSLETSPTEKGFW